MIENNISIFLNCYATYLIFLGAELLKKNWKYIFFFVYVNNHQTSILIIKIS